MFFGRSLKVKKGKIPLHERTVCDACNEVIAIAQKQNGAYSFVGADGLTKNLHGEVKCEAMYRRRTDKHERQEKEGLATRVHPALRPVRVHCW